MQAEYHLPFRSARPLQCKAEWGGGQNGDEQSGEEG